MRKGGNIYQNEISYKIFHQAFNAIYNGNFIISGNTDDSIGAR